MNTPSHTFIVADPDYTKHLTGIGHPECPKRYEVILKMLRDTNLISKNNLLQPREATEEEVQYCHTPEYYNLVKNETHKLEVAEQESEKNDIIEELSTGDTKICKDSFMVAKKAAGGVITAIDAVMTGVAKNAFCIIRPPGHHAHSEVGGGFCIFNNIAIGARYAQKKYNIERVLIVDWDVHHGDGTQDIFYNDPSVFYFSTHNCRNYPGTGKKEEAGQGKGLGTNLNCPIEPGPHARKEVVEAFSNDLLEAMVTFKPQLVLISAGFDAHIDDPLGGFNLIDEDYATLTKIVKKIADKYAEGKIISVLEGGYRLDAIARSVKLHVETLAE